MRKLVNFLLMIMLISACTACSKPLEIKQSTHAEVMETFAQAMERGDYETMAGIYPDLGRGITECNSNTSYPADMTEYEIGKELWSKIRGTAEVNYLGILKQDTKACYSLEFTASRMPGDNFCFNSDTNVNFNFILLENWDGKWFITDTVTGMFFDENSFIEE